MIDSMMPLSGDAAETLGLEALGWIAAQPDLSGAFLATTGGAVEDIHKRASEPEFLGFVLDFLLCDEEMLLAFCADQGIRPDRPLRARAALPGGDLPNWT